MSWAAGSTGLLKFAVSSRELVVDRSRKNTFLPFCLLCENRNLYRATIAMLLLTTLACGRTTQQSSVYQIFERVSPLCVMPITT